MKRLKKFLLYAAMIVGFWVFSDIISYVAIKSNYDNIYSKIYINSPEISIKESKATYVNGVIKGSLKNNTDTMMNGKYLKIELYSARDVKLGTKYIKIENLEPSKYQEFEMWYKFTDVEYANITVTDNIENATEEEFISEETAAYIVVGTLILLYFL